MLKTKEKHDCVNGKKALTCKLNNKSIQKKYI